MKLSRITLTLAVSSCFCFQCSCNSTSVTSQNRPGNYANSGATQFPSADPNQQRDARGNSQLVQSALAREAERLGLRVLSQPMPNDSSEIRFWVGFGILEPRCFMLKKIQGNQEAFFITSEGSGEKTANDSRKVKIRNTRLTSPRSGWSDFERFLNEQGIDFPIELISEISPDPDAEIIVVESRWKDIYSLVYFSLANESKDGQKVQAVCKKIEQEFDVMMGCRP